MKTSHSLFQNQFFIRSKIKSNSNYKLGFYFLRMFMKQKERLCKKKFKKRILFKGTLLCTCSICVCTTKCFRFLFGLSGTVQREFWHPTLTIDPPPPHRGANSNNSVTYFDPLISGLGGFDWWTNLKSKTSLYCHLFTQKTIKIYIFNIGNYFSPK